MNAKSLIILGIGTLGTAIVAILTLSKNEMLVQANQEKKSFFPNLTTAINEGLLLPLEASRSLLSFSYPLQSTCSWPFVVLQSWPIITLPLRSIQLRPDHHGAARNIWVYVFH